MARTVVSVTTLEGAYGDYGAGEADVALQVSDLGNKNYVMVREGDIVIVHNKDVGVQDFTINSVASQYGRTADISAYSLAADDIAVFGPFRFHGWRQTTGWLHFEGSHADVRVGVLRGAKP